VSYDNGATFLSDGVNYDTYGNASTLLYQSTAGTYVYTNPTYGGVQDPTSWLSSDYDPGSFYGYAGLSRAAHFDQYWDIFPGDVNTFFRPIIRGMSDSYYAAQNGGFGFLVGATTVSSLSTIPNPKGRVNYMRFGGFGCLSGFDTTKTLSGNWYLLGLPQAGPPPQGSPHFLKKRVIKDSWTRRFFTKRIGNRGSDGNKCMICGKQLNKD
jgi:hypothetical protein